MTEKLYENAYLTEFDAQVLSCVLKNGMYEVVLDRTAFFPEGGGQPADEGFLDEQPVLDVQERDGVIFHTVEAPLTGTVHGEVFASIRYPRMQSHTGEHIVSGIVHKLYGYNNVGFHMADDCLMTVDFDGVLSEEQLAKVEHLANDAVCENRKVTVTFPEHPETMTYRSKLDLVEGVRLVEIEDVDVCACCAPHVSATGEVGLIKILSVSPHRGGSRITMRCGGGIYGDYSMLHRSATEISRMLSVPREEILSGAEKLCEEIQGLKAEISELKEALAKATLAVSHIGAWTVGCLGDAGFDALRTIINEMEGNVALFTEGGAYMLRGEGAGELTKKINAAFSGKGGGKPNFTQGKCTATKDEILAFFEEMK